MKRWMIGICVSAGVLAGCNSSTSTGPGVATLPGGGPKTQLGTWVGKLYNFTRSSSTEASVPVPATLYRKFVVSKISKFQVNTNTYDDGQVFRCQSENGPCEEQAIGGIQVKTDDGNAGPYANIYFKDDVGAVVIITDLQGDKLVDLTSQGVTVIATKGLFNGNVLLNRK